MKCSIGFYSRFALVLVSVTLLWSLRTATSWSALPLAGYTTKIAIVDSWGPSHDGKWIFDQSKVAAELRINTEVLAPILWTLNQYPNVHVDVYRSKFRTGFGSLLKGWFTESLHRYRDFWKRDLRTVDIIFLTTGDRDISKILRSAPVLDLYPHLKIVAIVHQIQHWDIEAQPPNGLNDTRYRPISRYDLLTVAKLAMAERLSFVVLSQHVGKGLREAMARNLGTPTRQPLDIEVFVPVSNYNTGLKPDVKCISTSRSCPSPG